MESLHYERIRVLSVLHSYCFRGGFVLYEDRIRNVVIVACPHFVGIVCIFVCMHLFVNRVGIVLDGYKSDVV